MRDMLALARWCDALPDRIDQSASDLAVKVADTINRDLIAHTPVDITAAVSNWQISISAPVLFELPAIYPGVRGSTAPQSRQAAVEYGVRVLKTKKPGETIYLSNLTPYIIDLNNGTSKQEPPGFFERGILVGERLAANSSLEIRA